MEEYNEVINKLCTLIGFPQDKNITGVYVSFKNNDPELCINVSSRNGCENFPKIFENFKVNICISNIFVAQ